MVLQLPTSRKSRVHSVHTSSVATLSYNFFATILHIVYTATFRVHTTCIQHAYNHLTIAVQLITHTSLATCLHHNIHIDHTSSVATLSYNSLAVAKKLINIHTHSDIQ